MLAELDWGILNTIQTMLGGRLDGPMLFFSRLGDAGFVWLAIGVGLSAFPRTRRVGLLVLAALVLQGVVINLLLKPLVQRVRPCVAAEVANLLLPIPPDYSFPSGHTGASFAAAGVLWQRMPRVIGWAGLLLAACIAFSRVYLYVHFPTDVLAGVAIGLASAWLVVRYRRPNNANRGV